VRRLMKCFGVLVVVSLVTGCGAWAQNAQTLRGGKASPGDMQLSAERVWPLPPLPRIRRTWCTTAGESWRTARRMRFGGGTLRLPA
jgi:hypothetical protein